MSVTVLCGNVREQLATLADGSIQCCVTSPPYWGLRDYGVVGQLGLEKTPEDYVRTMVDVFRGVRRVLRDDGTLWLNLGDSYAAGGQNSGSRPEDLTDKQRSNAGCRYEARKAPAGLKPKDLVGIPWRVAFALQADGWYLRSDIIWEKPNPMPESVTDRTTRSHEYVFLLTKRERYFYDAFAIKEALAPKSLTVSTMPYKGNGTESTGEKLNKWMAANGGRYRDVSGRNARSVWRISSRHYPGAHFATFPPELPKRCILAGTSEHGVCASCGAPYRRRIEKGAPLVAQQDACGGDGNGEYHGQATKDYTAGGAQNASAVKARILAGLVERRTVGWDATCTCRASVVPAMVLDPFGGSGTTAMVCVQERRNCTIIELNPSYVPLIEDRILKATPKEAA